ncbi:MAG: nucleotidyltransferase family protein [Acidobacteriia bacterium]|nr:nucleotidyltransferase family protein [Terriglobia bacterium]
MSSFLTFMGFSGIDKIHTYLGWIVQIDKDKVEFAFNLLVFVLFVLAILHLVFQFGRKQSEAERAIVSLTNLINQIDDLIARSEASYGMVTQEEHEIIRQKYEMLIAVIPSNSDREFLGAKIDYDKKETKHSGLKIRAQDLFDVNRQKAAVELIVQRSPEVMEILSVLRGADKRLHLGGGLVRNLVWDYLHGYRSSTPIDDVDVVYFDKLSDTKEHDREIERKLAGIIPNLQWSVKNQARMHVANSDDAYSSLEDSICKWPETATAFAIRLGDGNHIEMLAPYGFSDLFRLLVIPTPHFRNRIERIRERAATKNWEKRWPNLRMVLE